MVERDRNIRIGIDVGGTFTHAVAIDGDALKLLGKARIPTTHSAAEGVALGIVQSLKKLLDETGVRAADVSFIAHSTTQATNALLEGDVAKVGILGMGHGTNGILARNATCIKQIRLAPGRFLSTCHKFLDTTKAPSDDNIKKAIDALVEAGAEAIAVSEAFGVDEPANEEKAVEIALGRGLPATSGSAVSQLYGLKIRTRTAVINASMLPKMIESADMTEESVREAGIDAPVMIMRSDGGVMDIDSMRRRPILTMLSGPAAGVAAAMMYLNISDGIFLEVGGTSTDISAIRNGRALVRSAEVGGHKIYMQTLDVRTVGVAGGSMPRIVDNEIVDVGPRSAHIAGYDYVSFSEKMSEPSVETIRPAEGDPDDYSILTAGARKAAITTTCAANLLGLVPEGDCARGYADSIESAFAALSSRLDMPAADCAEVILGRASDKIIPVVSSLFKDYKLDNDIATIVGGGGGAASIVPFAAGMIGARYSLSENADVISAIGVALALVRETVEKNIINPSADEILKIREEAQNAVARMGAEPDSIEVFVEVDSRTNTVRATASGATSLTGNGGELTAPTQKDQLALAASSLRVGSDQVKVIAENEHFTVFGSRIKRKGLGGIFGRIRTPLRIVDRKGVIRLQIRNGAAVVTGAASAENVLSGLAESYAEYGDAGRVIPPMSLLVGSRIVDLAALLDINQVQAVAKAELSHTPADSKIIAVAEI